MSIIKRLITHRHAPELNKTQMRNGVEIHTPGLTSIRDVRRLYFSRRRQGRYALISVVNDGVNIATYSGYINSYKTVKNFMLTLNERHNLPNTTFTLKLKQIS
jgi:hypothetical protein